MILMKDWKIKIFSHRFGSNWQLTQLREAIMGYGLFSIPFIEYLPDHIG